jgi:DNA (cytosine-5)-methyltransferase 1
VNELALFAGAGGVLPGKLLGWTPVCAVELAEYPREVLLQRQRDGHLPAFPVWDDISSFDGTPWRGLVDVITGGFPCQDISGIGKGEGLAGARSGLWFEMLRVIEEVQPRYVFAENSPNLRTRGLGVVIKGLTSLGYDVRWGVLGAWHASASHRRNRMWICAELRPERRTLPLADTERKRLEGHPGHDSTEEGRQEQERSTRSPGLHRREHSSRWW